MILARVATKVAAAAGAAETAQLPGGPPHMLDISMALCHAATCQVCAAAALQARFAGKAVIIGLPVPMDSLLPLGRRPT